MPVMRGITAISWAVTRLLLVPDRLLRLSFANWHGRVFLGPALGLICVLRDGHDCLTHLKVGYRRGVLMDDGSLCLGILGYLILILQIWKS